MIKSSTLSPGPICSKPAGPRDVQSQVAQSLNLESFSVELNLKSLSMESLNLDALGSCPSTSSP